MADAGLFAFKIEPPANPGQSSVEWVFEDGSRGQLIAFRPGSGVTFDAVSSYTIQEEAKSCVGGAFATMRLPSRYHNGSEIQKLDAVCSGVGRSDKTSYSIIALPNGSVLRFGSMSSGAIGSNDDRGTRLENAAWGVTSARYEQLR